MFLRTQSPAHGNAPFSGTRPMSSNALLKDYAPIDAASERGPDMLAIERAIAQAREALHKAQKPDGHFVFELEADITIPAEYILLRHYLAEPVDSDLERKVTAYIRRKQADHDGWPLFHGGAFDMSASVKAYFALKMMGEDINAPHMKRAREAILARGGAAKSNVFTRILLALYGEVPWRAVPVMPVEILLLPKWFPFHLDKVSYWARTVMVPLLVLQALKPRARNPKDIHVGELFVTPPAAVREWPTGAHQNPVLVKAFGVLDDLLRFAEPHFPKALRQRAIDKAVAFVRERLNGEDGLGAIYPAMANSVMMFDVLGYKPDHPDYATARGSLEKLLVVKENEAYCQPCVSPVWDTALVCHTLLEAGDEESVRRARHGLEWLKPLQVLDVKGDWAVQRPNVRPGGWAFQYANPHYPDLDDTAVVVLALDRAKGLDPSRDAAADDEAMARAKEWILGLQSKNGGFAAFDADNTHHYLNHIPFADHGALLDPPTEDVTARCISMLGQLGDKLETSEALRRAVDYLFQVQMPDGSWFGRWGVNYIYGTWSCLCALNAIGLGVERAEIRRAADWLIAIQNEDGGWGEDGDSYKLGYKGYEPHPSSSSQTAWAVLGLMAIGDVDHPAVKRGVDYLNRTQGADGFWPEDHYTGGGFPRVFYLRYHGYSKFFPLWALARYRNLKNSNAKAVLWGM